ncbi:hypothetical protein BJ912DRAFT_217383 [Pholiota molesta]|nr:hypothetical protein BJ912DRAFT_217383 [Pholiota molesta]
MIVIYILVIYLVIWVLELQKPELKAFQDLNPHGCTCKGGIRVRPLPLSMEPGCYSCPNRTLTHARRRPKTTRPPEAKISFKILSDPVLYGYFVRYSIF